jgi:hypothetical protein
MAYRRELWHIVSGSEVRFMCNITPVKGNDDDEHRKCPGIQVTLGDLQGDQSKE